MQVVKHVSYVSNKRTLNQAIQEKIKILKEFYVIDNNEYEIKQKLYDAVRAEPNKDFDIILDRVTHTMIMDRLNK